MFNGNYMNKVVNIIVTGEKKNRLKSKRCVREVSIELKKFLVEEYGRSEIWEKVEEYCMP